MQPKPVFLSPLVLCLGLCLSALPGLTTASPEVHFTASATSVSVGHAIKLRCEVKNYNLGTEGFQVYFFQDDTHFTDYMVYLNNKAERTTVFEVNHVQTGVPGYEPVSSTFPVYEINITPHTEGKHNFKCNLFNGQGGSIDVYSNQIPITVTR